MLLSKLKRLNPTKITHHFSKSRLGFCSSSNIFDVYFNGAYFIGVTPFPKKCSSNIAQQQQKQDTDEIIKHVIRICNDPHWPDQRFHRAFIVTQNPNVDLYNHVIHAYYKIEKPKGAKRVFSLMKEKDCSPNCDTYKLMMGDCFRRGEVDEALKLKNEMVAKGMKLDVMTYIFIIKGLTSCSRFKEAIKLLEGMKDDGVLPNTKCYYYIIRDLCGKKRTEEAWDVIAQMVENKLNPNHLTMRALRSAYGSLDTKENVLMHFKELIAHGIIPDQRILATLFEIPFGRGNTREVLLIMVNVIDDSILSDNLDIYGVFLQRFLQYEEMDLARELLSEMYKRGFIPDCQTYGNLLFGFIDNGDEEKAQLLFNEMKQRNICPNRSNFSKVLETRLPGRRRILLNRWRRWMKKKKKGVTLV